MPKGRSKKRKDKSDHVKHLETASLDEDSESVDSSLDQVSVVSEDGGGTMEEELEEDMDFQLGEHIDQLGDKNSRTRLEALSQINKILSQKVATQSLAGSKETLLDIIIRGLKKVHGKERLELLQLSMLLAIQLGEDLPSLTLGLRQLATQLALDPAVSEQERTECVHMLGIVVFTQVSDLLEIGQMMRTFEDIFTKCRLDMVTTSAVKSWMLLLSIAPSHTVPTLFQSVLPVFNDLLGKSASMSVRLVVGQAIALLFELTREADESLLEHKESEIAYDIVQQLATESDRHTARKDRNQQRSSFRDFLQTLDEGIFPDKSIKTGLEVLSLNSWSRLVQYDSFRDILGSGMKTHLTENDLLRDIFQLGPPPLLTVESKAVKMERKYYNAVLAKHRSQSRGKQRDKRAVL